MAYGKLMGRHMAKKHQSSAFQNTRLGQEPFLPQGKGGTGSLDSPSIKQPSRWVQVLEVNLKNDFKKAKENQETQQLQERCKF